MNISPSFPSTLSQEVRDTLRGWRKLGSHYGSKLGPEHDIRIIDTGKIYRVGDFAYQRMLKGAKPTPYGWMELTEDGDLVEGPVE